MTTTSPAPSAGSTRTPTTTPQAPRLPTIRRFHDDHGDACCAVELFGKNGAGKEVILLAADWRHASETIGPVWLVTPIGRCDYVVSCSTGALRELARIGSKSATLSLARYLVGALDGQVAAPVNGNNLDLRRRNIVVRTAAEHVRSMRAKRRADCDAAFLAQLAAVRAANEAAEAVAR